MWKRFAGALMVGIVLAGTSIAPVSPVSDAIGAECSEAAWVCMQQDNWICCNDSSDCTAWQTNKCNRAESNDSFEWE